MLFYLPPSATVSTAKEEIKKPLLTLVKKKDRGVEIKEWLKRILNTSYVDTGINCLYYKDKQGRFTAIRYELLQPPFNQLALIVSSKYYQVSNTNNDRNADVYTFRDGSDGLPDIIDASIAHRAYTPDNLVTNNNPYEWINDTTNEKGYPEYPRHMRSTVNGKTMWR